MGYESEGDVRPQDIEDPEYAAKKTVNKVYECLSESRGYRRQFDKDWPKFYLLYIGQHWDGRQADWQSTPVINLTWSVIQTIVPILTDGKPQIKIVPRQPEHENIAEVFNMLVEWHWDRLSLDRLLPMVMTNAMIFGNGFMKVLWDSSMNGGEGDVNVIPVDPVNVFISPYSRSLDEADYIIHAENMTRQAVERMYPGILDEKSSVSPEDASLTVNRNVTSQQAGSEGQISWVRSTDGASTFGYRGNRQNAPGSAPELITVVEKWTKTAGLYRQTICVNDKLAYDGENTLGLKRYPIVHFVDHPHTWSAWAVGEVQQVEKLQIEINRRRGHILDILRWTANPMLIVDAASGIEQESLQQRPGLVVPVEGGIQSVQWLQPPAIPNALFQVNEMDKADFDIVLGNVDVLQGRRPQGVEAGVAIELLQEAANVRMRQKVHYMEEGVRKIGELFLNLMQHFYDTERVFRISGTIAARLEAPITNDMAEMQAQWLSVNQPTEGSIGPDGQPVMGMNNAIPKVEEAEFDVKIGAGSTLPTSKSTQFQKAITLFQMGQLSPAGLMRHSGLPDWERELAEAQQYQMQQMQQQMAMQTGMTAQPTEPTEGDVDQAIEENEPQI